ncbi:hypothetical protein BJX68DRAFT_269928 [Aspergillus pseudodeflectus]|uniref:Uncharacterized protein n=1 Tax=Aspergillus pseudodeflectus TaxID=176178 RepID=A0ABR4JVC2_9EURO
MFSTDSPSPNSSPEAAKEPSSESTPEQTQLTSLLSPVRYFDWHCGIHRALETPAHRTAALLHRRGHTVTPCSNCVGDQDRAWGRCVVAPVYKSQSILCYVCSNCVFKGDVSGCSHREAFEKTGGQEWDSAVTRDIVARGGLRAVLNAEFDTSAAETTTGPRRSMKKAKEENIPSRQEPESMLPGALEPQSPTSSHSNFSEPPETEFHGAFLPWPVSLDAWNDPDVLRCMVDDWRAFMEIAEARIAELEGAPPIEYESSYEYWSSEYARLFPS